MIGRVESEALERDVGTRGTPGRSTCKHLNMGDNCFTPLGEGESWWAIRHDIGKNWTLRVSGRPYQTDVRDVNVLPGRVVRPPICDPANAIIAS
jgi:hypothetical protein